jgi:hypothetical protein
MKNLFLIILTLITFKVTGQNNLLGVKVGSNCTNINSSNFSSQNNTKTGLSAGLTFEFLIQKHFSLGMDLIYNQLGFSDDILFTDNQGNITGEKNTTTFNYDYVSVPIKSGFTIGNKLYGFTNIGIVPSILINASTTMLNEKHDVTNRVSKFDFAGLVEIGGGYKFSGRYWLFTSFSYQQSFTTITNSNYFANRKITHYGMTFNLGLKYALTKE